MSKPLRGIPPFHPLRLRRILSSGLACALLAGALQAQPTPAPPPPLPGSKTDAATAGSSAPVVVVPVEGMVSKAQFIFLRRVLKQAMADGAQAVVVDMDTPGGELQAAVDIVDAFQNLDIPTVTYVNKNAGSAGALIALATDRIYMAPVSAIGAAAPVMGGGQEMGETMTDKVVSYYSKYFRSAAERSGHNPDLAEAFINKDVEVKIGDKVISEKDSLLTLSPQEAAEVVDGKPVLASGIADSIEEAVGQAGFDGEIVRIEPTGMEMVAFYITMLAPALLMGGIVGAYIEFKSPGFGIPGILASLCFILFFTGHYLAGLAGQEALVVFLLGALLVIAELLFFPGVLFVALAGVAMMVGGLLWAMVDRYPTDPVIPDFSMLAGPLLNLGIALAGGMAISMLLAIYLPRTRMFERIVLGRALAEGASLPASGPASEYDNAIAPGTRGRATTDLYPAGKARIGDRHLDVLSEGDYVQEGDAIEVVAVRNGAIVVRKTE